MYMTYVHVVLVHTSFALNPGSQPSSGELFAEFDDKPLAAASLGQVHRAKTKDGVEMAIKIQRDNLKEHGPGGFRFVM